MGQCEQPPSEFPSSPNAHKQLHQPDNAENWSRGQFLFLGAPGEARKTYIFIAIQNCLKAFHRNFIAVPSFAVAAKLKNSRKAHFAFDISLSCSVEDTCYISDKFDEAQKFLDVLFNIWYEVRIWHLRSFEPYIKMIMLSSHLFGGKLFQFAGDSRKSFQYFHLVPGLRFSRHVLGNLFSIKASKLFDYQRT